MNATPQTAGRAAPGLPRPPVTPPPGPHRTTPIPASTPAYQADGATLLTGDCLQVLHTLPDATADATITDPPYNVGVDYGPTVAAAGGDRRPDGEYVEWLAARLAEAARVTVPGGPIVWSCGVTNVWRVAEVCERAGLTPRRLLGWHRRDYAGDRFLQGPAMSWEPIVWATRPDVTPVWHRQAFGAAGRDLLTIPTARDPLACEHPAPKPPPVAVWLVGMFVPAEGTVLDPFAGTGTVLRAAIDQGRYAVGVELEPRWASVAVRRLAQRSLHAPPEHAAHERNTALAVAHARNTAATPALPGLHRRTDAPPATGAPSATRS